MNDESDGPEPPKYQESITQEVTRRNCFTYHAPKSDQPERYSLLRMHGDDLARILNENCPPSREQISARIIAGVEKIGRAHV